MTDETSTRRRLLRLGGGGLAVAVAGCVGPGEGGEEGGEENGGDGEGGEEGGEGGEEALDGEPTDPPGPEPQQ